MSLYTALELDKMAFKSPSNKNSSTTQHPIVLSSLNTTTKTEDHSFTLLLQAIESEKLNVMQDYISKHPRSHCMHLTAKLEDDWSVKGSTGTRQH